MDGLFGLSPILDYMHFLQLDSCERNRFFFQHNKLHSLLSQRLHH